MLIKSDTLKKIHDNFVKQLETGVVIVPAYFEAKLINVPDNIEVIFESGVEVCTGCKFDLTNRVVKDDEELCYIIDRCSNCKRAVYPPDVANEKDLYEPIKE